MNPGDPFYWWNQASGQTAPRQESSLPGARRPISIRRISAPHRWINSTIPVSGGIQIDRHIRSSLLKQKPLNPPAGKLETCIADPGPRSRLIKFQRALLVILLAANLRQAGVQFHAHPGRCILNVVAALAIGGMLTMSRPRK
jgi:hypothetical protein